MKTKVSPAVVGAFVLGAFTLGVLALLFFGGVSFFHKQQSFVVLFDEPVQGLTNGQPVKLRGVLVGRVDDLKVHYDQEKNHPVVEVLCEFTHPITDLKGAVIDVGDRKVLQTLVDRGLRAQLGVTSLAAGILYVELDFLDPVANPADTHLTGLAYPVVPAVTSTIQEFQNSATEILSKLKRVDFEGLADNFKSLLADTRKQVDTLDLKGLGAQWQKTGASVEALANSPEIKQSFANLNATLAEVRSALADLHTSLGQVDAQVGSNGQALQAALQHMQASLDQFAAAAVAAHQFINAQQGLGDDTHRALTQLAGAAESVQRLADFLERNPNALVSGRKPPP
jgi:paraquat-inducible protein B